MPRTTRNHGAPPRPDGRKLPDRVVGPAPQMWPGFSADRDHYRQMRWSIFGRAGGDPNFDIVRAIRPGVTKALRTAVGRAFVISLNAKRAKANGHHQYSTIAAVVASPCGAKRVLHTRSRG